MSGSPGVGNGLDFTTAWLHRIAARAGNPTIAGGWAYYQVAMELFETPGAQS